MELLGRLRRNELPRLNGKEKENRAKPYVKGEIPCIDQIHFQVLPVPCCCLDIPPCGRLAFLQVTGVLVVEKTKTETTTLDQSQT